MLDTKSAGGLVKGMAPGTSGQTVRVKVLRGFMHQGEVPAIGSIIEVDSRQARGLIGSNKAEISEEDVKPKKAKKAKD